MNKILISLMAMMCIALPCWSSSAFKSMPDIEFDRWNTVTPFLCCETNETDTTWTLEIWGRGLDENALLLLKTGDGKVVGLQPVRHRLYQETDSFSTSPVTGETIEHWHYKYILEYQLTATALNYFMKHGVTKLRLGTEDRWREKSWKRDELGQNLLKAYRKILDELSPDYVPPKKKTIYDDF